MFQLSPCPRIDAFLNRRSRENKCASPYIGERFDENGVGGKWLMGALLRIPLTLMGHGNGALGGEIILLNYCKWLQMRQDFLSGCNCSIRGQIQRKPARAQLRRSDMFIVTVPPMICSSSVGAAWSTPDLTMPPGWGLRRFCLGAGTINMSLLRSWSLSSRRSLPPSLAPQSCDASSAFGP